MTAEFDIYSTVAGTLGGGGVIAYVFIQLLSKWKESNKDNSVNDSQSKFVSNMTERVQKLEDQLTTVYTERNGLVQKVADLSGRIEILKELSETNERLKKRLDEKDDIIAAKDARIDQLLMNWAEERQQWTSENLKLVSRIELLNDEIERLRKRLLSDERDLFLRSVKDEISKSA